MADIAVIRAEVRLLRWGDSSTAGRTVTLELHPDEGERHPFCDFVSGAKNGQRFQIIMVPIGDDEEPLPAGPVSEEAPARSLPPTQPKVRNPDAADRAKAAFHADTKEGQAARLAGMMRKDPEYRKWLVGAQISDEPDKTYAEAVAQEQRILVGVKSCSEIATDPKAFQRWQAHKLAFEQAVGRAARPS